jgi:hypothetical protein
VGWREWGACDASTGIERVLLRENFSYIDFLIDT